MSQIANWRRAKDDPTTVRGWLYANSSRQSGRIASLEEKKRIRLTLGLLGLYMTFAVAALVWVPQVSRFLSLTGVMSWPILALVSNKKKEEAPPEEREEGALVTMALRDRRGMTTGTDRGRLIECDGWLLFEGTRASFALTTAVARRGRYDPLGQLRLSDGRSVEFERPVGMEESSPSLGQTLRLWERAPVPEGVPILPPVPVHPGVWVDRWTGAVAASVVCLLPMGLGLVLRWPWLWVGGLLGASVSFVVASCYARVLRAELPRAFAEPGRALAPPLTPNPSPPEGRGER